MREADYARRPWTARHHLPLIGLDPRNALRTVRGLDPVRSDEQSPLFALGQKPMKTEGPGELRKTPRKQTPPIISEDYLSWRRAIAAYQFRDGTVDFSSRSEINRKNLFLAKHSLRI